MYGHNSGLKEEFELAADEIALLTKHAEFVLCTSPKDPHRVFTRLEKYDVSGNVVMEDDHYLQYKHAEADKKVTSPRKAAAAYHAVYDFSLNKCFFYNVTQERVNKYTVAEPAVGNVRYEQRFDELEAPQRIFLEVARRKWRVNNGLPATSEVSIR